MRRRLRVLLTILLPAAALACSDLPDPGAVTLVVRSQTGADDGAAVLRVTGGPFGGIRSLDSPAFMRSGADRGSMDVVVVSPEGGRLTVEVLLIDRDDDLDVEVLQVADVDNELRSDLSGYRVEVAR